MVSVYGAHLHLQATEELLQPTAEAVPPSPSRRGGVTAAPADIVVDAKRALRAVSHEVRRAAREAAAADAGEAAARHFFSAIEPAPGCVVSGYWPIDAEFDVRPLLGALHARGHPCGLPVVVGKGRPLVFRSWRPGEALEAAAFGTSVPRRDAPEVTPGLLLVPLLAFDDRGFRLGYGGGYYDMTLGALGADGRAVTAVGVGFEAQRVDRVPAGATDRRLDWVVTEARARRIA